MAAERLAIVPGSFDPLTCGHVDIVRRSLALFDRVVVAVLVNSAKTPMFSLDDRLAIVRETFADTPAVEAAQFEGLLVDFARARGACAIVRGLRSAADFEYEWPMVQMNRQLCPSIETVLLTPSPEFGYVSSTLIRDVVAFGGDVQALLSIVPPLVAARLTARSRRT